jgi:hypothetical protein
MIFINLLLGQLGRKTTIQQSFGDYVNLTMNRVVFKVRACEKIVLNDIKK